MAQSNWIRLVTQGLTLADRANSLLAQSATRTTQVSRGTVQTARIDPLRALTTAHRILDVLEGKPQRRGFFW